MKLIKDLGVIYITEKSKTKRRAGLYECPGCNNEFTVQTSNVKAGKSTKCKSCAAIESKTTHGLKYHPLYSVWSNMKSRCYNKKNNRYVDWGGRGVTVCPEWIKNFKSFYEWSMKNGWNEKMRLDKDIICEKKNINPSIYSPETCMYVTQTENSRATRLIRRTNTSGYKGVSFNKKKEKWISQISVDNKKIQIGAFFTKEEAAYAYDDYITTNDLSHTKNFKRDNNNDNRTINSSKNNIK